MIKIKNLLTHILAALTLAVYSGNLQATDCDSVNQELTSKFRFLGEWHPNGTPKYLEEIPDTVKEDLKNFVETTLPERVSEDNEDYFRPGIQFNTELKEQSKVFLTMVHEGADWKNTLGFYTFDINSPPQTLEDIDSLVVIFPNVTQPNVVQPGNTVLLGEFPGGTGIGYFLLTRGWVGDTICLGSHLIFTDSHLNTFTTPEFQQQAILLNFPKEELLLLCFEDMIRPSGDNDFNDAVFFVTAQTGAIDTTNIPVIPTAQISGDTSVCDANDPTELAVSLTGKGPWSLTITNGVEEQSFDNITEEQFSFETMLKDSIWIKSFSDVNRQGLASGSAQATVASPRATLSKETKLCGSEEVANSYMVEFEGVAPFALTYLVDGKTKFIEGIEDYQFPLAGEVGKSILLVSMNDKFCVGSVSEGVVEVQENPLPTLLVSGTGAICEGESATTLSLILDGEGPWIIDYLLNDQEHSIEVGSSQYDLSLEQLGVLEFMSISDANCSSNLTDIFQIEERTAPRAIIDSYTANCGEESALLELSLEGEGPWKVDYTMNEEEMSFESEESILTLEIAENGLFELVQVQDAYCSTTLNEIQEVRLLPMPSATISGDTTLCAGGEASVEINLTGEAPFTFTYTNGEDEISVETQQSTYEFQTSAFGTYSLVSLSDANCEGVVEGSATIADGSEDLNVEIDAVENSCYGEEIALALSGDTEGLSIAWSTDGKGSFANTDQLGTTYTPAEGEHGEVRFFAEVSNGCSVKALSKSIMIIEELTAMFDVSPNQDILTNTQITFTPENTSYDSYEWDFGDDTGSSAEMASTEYATGGIYVVQLSVEKNGCEAEGDIEIEVLSKDELYIPNAFHPFAQNPENQVVKVYGNNIEENDFHFKIVNRWGKVMYETRSFNEANSVGWDGVNNNTDETLELNVFTYIVRGRFIEGESFEKTGTITQVK